MDSVKVVISGVPPEAADRLDELVETMKSKNTSLLPVDFNRSVLLRFALDEFLRKYGENPDLLFSRFQEG